MGGDLFVSPVRWILYWGYWKDGVEEPLPIADYMTYSYNSNIVGTRFGIVPTELLDDWPIQIGIFIGAAHHFITGTWVGGAGLDGRPGEDLTENVATFEIGLNAEIIVIEPIAVRGELQQYIPLGNAYLDKLQKNRQSLKVGLALRF